MQADLVFEVLKTCENELTAIIGENTLLMSSLLIELLKKIKIEFGQLDQLYKRINRLVVRIVKITAKFVNKIHSKEQN